MKIERLIAAVALLMTAAIVSVSAQQQRPAAPAGTTPAPTTPQTASVAVPDSKMAVIYSDAFLDQKNGIARFNSLLTTLNREFQPRQAELQGLANSYRHIDQRDRTPTAVADHQIASGRSEIS